MKLVIAFLLTASVAWGQQPNKSKDPDTGEFSHLKINVPLKCGKYQHEDFADIYCGDTYPSTCHPPRCVDDIHILTEREWQELMAKLKELNLTKKQ